VDSFSNLSGPAQIVVTEETPRLLDNKSITDFIKDAAKAIADDAKTPLPWRVAVAKTLFETKSGSAAESAALVTQGGIGSRGVTVATCKEALTALKLIGAGVAEWTAAIQDRFPLAKFV
jgi:hypothetical protein